MKFASAISGIAIFCFALLFISPVKSIAQNNKPDTIAAKRNAGKILKLIAAAKGPVINNDHPDVIASNNRSGFETGQVVKINNVYHMFVNEMFGRPHKDLHIRNHFPKGGWPVGRAYALHLNGPWKRMPEEFNALHVADTFMKILLYQD